MRINMVSSAKTRLVGISSGQLKRNIRFSFNELSECWYRMSFKLSVNEIGFTLMRLLHVRSVFLINNISKVTLQVYLRYKIEDTIFLLGNI